MPNWTSNYIQIRGTKEDLDKFIEDGIKRTGDDAKEGDYSFGSWIPRPETYDKYDTTNHPNGKGLEVGKPQHPWEKDSLIITAELILEYKRATAEQMQKYGCVGWYDWNLRNYGCKWDMPFFIQRTSDTEATIDVDTPWTAPSEFLLTISQRYPTLEFEVNSHYEDGMNDWRIYNEGCEMECDLDEFQSDLHEYLTKRVNEAETIDEEPITDENRPKYLKAVEWYITSGYWRHTSLEDNWDCFEGDVNWIIPDCVESEEEPSEA